MHTYIHVYIYNITDANICISNWFMVSFKKYLIVLKSINFVLSDYLQLVKQSLFFSSFLLLLLQQNKLERHTVETTHQNSCKSKPISRGCNDAIFWLIFWNYLFYKKMDAKTTKAQVKAAAMVSFEALLHRAVVCLQALLQRPPWHLHSNTSWNSGSLKSPWSTPRSTPMGRNNLIYYNYFL